MMSTTKQCSLAIPLCFVAIAAYTGVALALASQSSIASAIWTVLAENSSLGFGLLLLSILEGTAPWRVLKIAATVVVFSILLLYLADAFVLVSLNARLDLVQAAGYAREVRTIASFASPGKIALFLLLCLSPFFHMRISWKKYFVGAVTLSLLMILPKIAFPNILIGHLLRGDVVSINIRSIFSQYLYQGQSQSDYTHTPYIHKQPRPWTFLEEWGQNKPNLILVIVESLSTVDSKRLSGINNYLETFDQLSQRGTVFRNFFANYPASDGAAIALLQGIAPVPYPGYSRILYESFQNFDSIPRYLSRHGFETEYLTTSPLSFLNQGHYAKSIGFDHVAGRDEIDRFKKAKRFTFDSPPDRLLYEEALSNVSQWKPSQNHFLCLATTSTHLPYKNPEGMDNSPSDVWHYAMRQLTLFCDQLEALGFFESGIVMIVGDHRKMSSVSKEEFKRYGEMHVGRVPLLLIGRACQKGAIDSRLWQQSDLFKKLHQAIYSTKDLCPGIFLICNYSLSYGDINDTGQVAYYSGHHVYHLRMNAAQIRWDGNSPADGNAILETLNTQRAYHQRLQGKALLRPPWKPSFIDTQRDMGARAQNGVLLEIYAGKNIDGILNQFDKHRFRQSIVVQNIIEEPVSPTHKPSGCREYTFQFLSFLRIDDEADYYFSLWSDDGGGLALDKEIVISANYARGYMPCEGMLHLKPGYHLLTVRYFDVGGAARIRLLWKRGLCESWRPIPDSVLYLPK